MRHFLSSSIAPIRREIASATETMKPKTVDIKASRNRRKLRSACFRELLSIVVDAGGLERGGVLWVNENYHNPFPKEYDAHARVYC